MKNITLELYGFEKKIDVSEMIYYSGRISIPIIRPLKNIIGKDFGELLSWDKQNVLDFYRDVDEVWRPIGTEP